MTDFFHLPKDSLEFLVRKKTNLAVLQKWEETRRVSFAEIKKITDNVKDEIFYIIKTSGEYQELSITLLEDRVKMDKEYAEKLFHHSTKLKKMIIGNPTLTEELDDKKKKKSSGVNVCGGGPTVQQVKILVDNPIDSMYESLSFAEEYTSKKIIDTMEDIIGKIIKNEKLNKIKIEQNLKPFIDTVQKEYIIFQTKIKHCEDYWKKYYDACIGSENCEQKNIPYEKHTYQDTWLAERVYKRSITHTNEIIKKYISVLENLILQVRTIESSRPLSIKELIQSFLDRTTSESTFPFDTSKNKKVDEIKGVFYYPPEIVKNCNILLLNLNNMNNTYSLKKTIETVSGLYNKDLTELEQASNAASIANNVSKLSSSIKIEPNRINEAAKNALLTANQPKPAFNFTDTCNQLLSLLTPPISSLLLKHCSVEVPENTMSGKIMSRWISGTLVLTIDRNLHFFKMLSDEVPLWTVKLPLCVQKTFKEKDKKSAEENVLYLVEKKSAFIGLFSSKVKVNIKFKNNSDFVEWSGIVSLYDSVASSLKHQGANNVVATDTKIHEAIEKEKENNDNKNLMTSNPFEEADKKISNETDPVIDNNVTATEVNNDMNTNVKNTVEIETKNELHESINNLKRSTNPFEEHDDKKSNLLVSEFDHEMQ